MKKILILLGVAVLFFGMLGTASAISISGGTYYTFPNGAKNDLLGTGIEPWGYYGANLGFDLGEQITFQFLGEEAGYNNEFHVNGSQVFTNNSSVWGASETFTVNNGFNFSFLADANGSKGSVVNGSNPDDSAGASTVNFIVAEFTSPLSLGDGSFLTRDLGYTQLDPGIYLWFDDGGAGPDDNHDDMLIRVSSAPVPEPATMVLFGIGLLGLAGLGRRKK